MCEIKKRERVRDREIMRTDTTIPTTVYPVRHENRTAYGEPNGTYDTHVHVRATARTGVGTCSVERRTLVDGIPYTDHCSRANGTETTL